MVGFVKNVGDEIKSKKILDRLFAGKVEYTEIVKLTTLKMILDGLGYCNYLGPVYY